MIAILALCAAATLPSPAVIQKGGARGGIHGHPRPGGGHHGHGGHGFLFATGVSFDWAVGYTEGETAESPAAQRAWDVVHRTIGDRAEAFDFILATPRKDGFVEFTVSAKAGNVAVVGTRVVSRGVAPLMTAPLPWKSWMRPRPPRCRSCRYDYAGA